MKRHIPIGFMVAMSMMLTACAGMLAGVANGVAPPPQQVADNTVVDENLALSAETFYRGFAIAGALAFRTGFPPPSSNPIVQDNAAFCRLVLARDPRAEPTDNGMRLTAIECKLRAARDAVRAAYDTANAVNYQIAYAQFRVLYTEGMALMGR